VKKGMLQKGDCEHGNLGTSGTKSFAVTPEQQRKLDVEGIALSTILPKRATAEYSTIAMPYGYRPETSRVLRL